MDNIKMVDVGLKDKTKRMALASSKIILKKSTLGLIKNKKLPKGDVLAVSKVAGINAAKETARLIPLCHPIQITNIEIDFKLQAESIEIAAKVEGFDRTGFEMEALTAAAVTALNIYDMAKAVDKDMLVTDIKLLKKTGGVSGDYER